jgi:hypothetical protein
VHGKTRHRGGNYSKRPSTGPLGYTCFRRPSPGRGCSEGHWTSKKSTIKVSHLLNGASISMKCRSTPNKFLLMRFFAFRSFNKSKGISAYASLSRDVFDCSELERAAHAAAHAQRSLSALSLSTTGSTGASMNQRLLEQRLHKLVDQLVQRIRARLSAIFSSAVSASTNVKIPDDPAAESSVPENSFPSRAFSHCLRALVALSKGQVAEEVVAETVTCPLAKPLLTQGRVDGNGGRGSYLGLKSALEALASQVTAALAMPLIVCAETFPATTLKGHDGIGASSSGNGNENGSASSTSAPVPIDLIVNGVWLPVAALLKEKFSGMFSVGIAGTLARCYTALEAFVLILKESEVAADNSGGIRDISSHPAIKNFHGYWKLDLYLQVGALHPYLCNTTLSDDMFIIALIIFISDILYHFSLLATYTRDLWSTGPCLSSGGTARVGDESY